MPADSTFPETLPSDDACSSKALSSRRSIEELGRKGAETRRRLMRATRDLLGTTSAVSLTATAIARAAGTSSATFYVYFDDVADAVLALARDASEHNAAVMDALADWGATLPSRAGAAAFLYAFRAHYEEHRPIFGIRNMEADRGDARFLKLRADSAGIVLGGLASLIRTGHGEAHPISERKAMARAAVMYSAMERLAATENVYPERPRLLTNEDIIDAQIEMLVNLVTPPA